MRAAALEGAAAFLRAGSEYPAIVTSATPAPSLSKRWNLWLRLRAVDRLARGCSNFFSNLASSLDRRRRPANAARGKSAKRSEGNVAQNAEQDDYDAERGNPSRMNQRMRRSRAREHLPRQPVKHSGQYQHSQWVLTEGKIRVSVHQKIEHPCAAASRTIKAREQVERTRRKKRCASGSQKAHHRRQACQSQRSHVCHRPIRHRFHCQGIYEFRFTTMK